MPQQQDRRGFPVSPCLCGSGGLMCARGARWTLSWVYECGLFCRLHLGLHMVRQTAVREAGGHVGRAPLQWALLHLHPPTGHRCKWHAERLLDDPARQNASPNPGWRRVLNFLSDGNSFPSPGVTCIVLLAVLYLPLVCKSIFRPYARCFPQSAACCSRTLWNVDEASRGPLLSPPPMINDLPPELQLPIIRTCHRHQHIITLCSDSLLSLFITGSNKQIIWRRGRRTIGGNAARPWEQIRAETIKSVLSFGQLTEN